MNVSGCREDTVILANKYILKVNNRKDRKRCEIYSKLKVYIIDVVLVSLLLNLNKFPIF